MISALSTLQNTQAKNSHATGRFHGVEDRFIDNWGQLAESIGMDERLGRIHAVLYLGSAPLTARAIAEYLELESAVCDEFLETLVSFGVVNAETNEAGDDVFEAERDPWSWFLVTIRERARREFTPLLASIRAVNTLAQEARSAQSIRLDPERSERIERISRFTHFVDQIASLLEMFSSLGAGPLMATMRMAAKFMPRG
jgi:DNA-binding transcriptional regulator GbsR (MarR family)